MAGHIADAGTVTWRTPSNIVDRLVKFFGAPPSLDPCAGEDSLVQAPVQLRLPEHNGLEVDWIKACDEHNLPRTCYVNPPYGTTYLEVSTGRTLSTKEWRAYPEHLPEEERRIHQQKLLAEGTWRKTTIAQWVERARRFQDGGLTTVMLLPAAVDTHHWQDVIFPYASALCHPQGRLRFVGAAQGATMAVSLVLFAPDCNLHWDTWDQWSETFLEIGRVQPLTPDYDATPWWRR